MLRLLCMFKAFEFFLVIRFICINTGIYVFTYLFFWGFYVIVSFLCFGLIVYRIWGGKKEGGEVVGDFRVERGEYEVGFVGVLEVVAG